MGGDDNQPTGGSQLADQPQHLLDLHVVEVGGWLVGDDQRRIVDQRSGDSCALLLAARHAGREVSRTVREPDPLEQLVGTPVCFPATDARQAKWRGDVLSRRQAGNQIEGLEDDADRPAPVLLELAPGQTGDLGRADTDRAHSRAQQRGQAGEQRGLARSARAEQDHQLPVVGREIQAVDRTDGVAALYVLDGEVLDLQGGQLSASECQCGIDCDGPA